MININVTTKPRLRAMVRNGILTAAGWRKVFSAVEQSAINPIIAERFHSVSQSVPNSPETRKRKAREGLSLTAGVGRTGKLLLAATTMSSPARGRQSKKKPKYKGGGARATFFIKPRKLPYSTWYQLGRVSAVSAGGKEYKGTTGRKMLKTGTKKNKVTSVKHYPGRRFMKAQNGDADRVKPVLMREYNKMLRINGF